MNPGPENFFLLNPLVNALLSSTLQGVVLINPNGNILAFNPIASKVARALAGGPFEAGHSFFSYFDPPGNSFWKEKILAATNGEIVSGIKKLTGVGEGNFEMPFDCFSIGQSQDTDNPVCICFPDVTLTLARSYFESSLPTNLADRFFEKNGQGILVVSEGGKDFRANPEFLRIFGLSYEELKDEIQRLSHPGKWDREFPFSLKHSFALPLFQESLVQILKPGITPSFARIKRTEIPVDEGFAALVLLAKDVSEEVLADRNRLDSQITEGRQEFCNLAIVNRNLEILFTDGTDYEAETAGYIPVAGVSILNQYGKIYHEAISGSIEMAFQGRCSSFDLEIHSRIYQIFISPLPESNGEINRVIKIALNITDNNVNGKGAAEERDYLRQIIDHDPNFVYVKNREGRVVLANQSIAGFFGTTVEDFLQNSSEYFKTFKWRYEEIHALEEQVFSGTKTITIEEAIFHKESHKMHLFQVTRTPFLYQGKEQGILCVGVDITDRVNAENELITQREYLRHILDTDPSLIFVKDSKGKYILVNRTFAEFYQCRPEDLIGKTDSDLPWGAPEIQRFQESDNSVVQSNEAINLQEYTINPVTGEESHFVTTKKPLLDAEGNLNILGVVTNITEQKKQEQQLRKSEFLLQQIFNKVADALFIIEADTLRIRDCNPKALDLLRAESKEALCGRHIQILSPQRESASRFWKNLFINIRDDNPVLEEELLNLEREKFWGSLAATSFEQEGKDVILLRISDISAQKKSEEQIMQALHEKEILIQEIHHRVKNNMAVISSLLQLQTGYIKDPGLIDVFRDSQSRIKSMALIHEKLYQSKTLAKVEMESYIKELTRTLFFTYNSRRIDLQIDTQVENVFLDINSAVPCGLIINEVISNSCKHAFVGREKGRIDIRFEKKEDQFLLEIKDDGVGMPPNTDFSSFKSLGMNLIQALSSQLGAQLEIHTQEGVCIRIAFIEKVKPSREHVRLQMG